MIHNSTGSMARARSAPAGWRARWPPPGWQPWSAVPTVIASAQAQNLMAKVLAGDPVGTWIEPQAQKLAARKLWIAFGLRCKQRWSLTRER